MTDTYEPDDNQTDEPSPRDLRHQLAEEKRQRAELETQLENVKRDSEFTRALGEHADAPWTKYFRSGYDGPVEADAIRKAASEAGFLQSQQQQGTVASPGLSDAYDRIAAASSGSGSPGKESWQDALNEADRITDQEARTAAILDVVERFGGITSRTAQ